MTAPRDLLPVLVTIVSLLAGCALPEIEIDSPGRASIRAITASAADTPGKLSLIAVLETETKIAAEHASFAARRPYEMKWMKTELEHVRHAIDPTSEIDGPGLGYGVIRAADSIARQIGLAAAAKGASRRTKLHAKRVQSAARNVGSWANEVMMLSDNALAETSDVQRIADLVRIIRQRLSAIRDGVDANQDGVVTWEELEGGIAQAKIQLGHINQADDT